MYFIYTHESPTRHFCFRYLRLVYELPSFNEGFRIISTEAQFYGADGLPGYTHTIEGKASFRPERMY